MLSGGCRVFLQAFFRRGAFLGPILVGLLGGKTISCLDTMCILFTVTLDKLNLFGDNFVISKKCLLVGIPSIAKIHNLFYI